MDTESLLTIPEAASLLGISQGAIRNAIAENRLPAVHKFGKNLIARADLEEYQARTQPDGKPPKGRPRRAAE